MAKRPLVTPAETGAAPTFEQAYAELNDIVAKLESAELPLEHALELHARGQQLAKYCGDLLEKAELQVHQIDPQAGGQSADS